MKYFEGIHLNFSVVRYRTFLLLILFDCPIFIDKMYISIETNKHVVMTLILTLLLFI